MHNGNAPRIPISLSPSIVLSSTKAQPLKLELYRPEGHWWSGPEIAYLEASTPFRLCRGARERINIHATTSFSMDRLNRRFGGWLAPSAPQCAARQRAPLCRPGIHSSALSLYPLHLGH